MVLLLSLSSESTIVLAATSPLQCGTTATSLPSSCVGVSTHGPLVNEVIFSINPSVLPSALSSGAIQAAEWTFTVANFNSITSSSIAKGVAAAYNAYGIAFNTIAPYANNLYFRQAIAYLVDYSYMKGTVLSGGEAGTAEANVMPCTSYPGACTTSAGSPPYGLNPEQAWKDLASAGLVPSKNCAPTYNATCMSATSWDVGEGFYGYANPTGGYATLGACPGATPDFVAGSKCAFSPTFYYRNDDPLRDEPSVQLCTVDAPMVGLALNCVGIPSTSAHPDVYTPAGLAINCVLGSGLTNGKKGTCDAEGDSSAAVTYNPATGYNTLNGSPVTVSGLFNSTIVNGTAAVSPTDGWSMYTYGWGLSDYYTFPYSFFNTAFIGSPNFVDFVNPQMDYYTNALIYATTPVSICTATVGSCGAQNAAQQVANLLITQLPYIGYFYSTELYAVEAAGWTGYSNLPAYGPSTEVGLGYTLLNVHPTSSAYGVGNPSSTYKIALHAVGDQSGLNPLYYTNWVWQSDIYSSIYDAPLATPPTLDTTPNAFINWMTVEPTTTMNGVAGIVNYDSIVQAFNGTTGTGTNWFNFGDLANPSAPNFGNNETGPDGSANVANNITDGQVVTLTFRNNLTWTDNVPVTAKDYQFSLYAWDIAGDSGTNTPLASTSAPPSGLIATELLSATGGSCSVAANTCMQIKMFVGSNSVWNLASLIVDVLPWHILDNFVTSGLSPSPTSALDLTQPSTSTATDAASDLSFCPVTTCLISDPTWMQYLPNLEVGSSAYYLSSYKEPPNGAAVITANANWDRAPWTVIAGLPENLHSSSFIFSTTISQFTYNPESTAFTYPGDSTSLASHATGYVGINNATVSIQLYNSTGFAVGSPVPMNTSGTDGVYTSSVPTSGLTAGEYEVVVNGTYSFLGLARTWYQASGFTFQPVVVTTSSTTTTIITSTTSTSSSTSTSKMTSTTSNTTSTTSTTTTSSSTYVYVGAAVIVIIVVVAAVYIMRRGPRKEPGTQSKS
jgi:ABC-type transport system substrate-binding protein